jgi:hypothetical protein
MYGLPFDSEYLTSTGAAFPLLEGVESFQISRTGNNRASRHAGAG